MSGPSLPVQEAMPVLLETIRSGRSVVLVAPPGAGKSTLVPPGMLDGLQTPVLVSQPRRIAARMLARRVATLRNSSLGGEVGFATRHERKSSDATRLLFLTEGLLLRRLFLSSDSPDGLVILDEFHERSVEADLLLGLLRSRGEPFVLMSATIDAERIADAIDGEVVEVDGRLHPIRIDHLRAPPGDPPWELARRSLVDVLEQDDEGDVLVFMPGRFEIDRTVEVCRGVAPGLDVLPLHGDLSADAQDRAVQPGPRRKVIVATNIAETSITIEGVTTVIDSGLSRTARYDRVRELDRLETTPIDQSSAVQRAGRAGRVRPGRCVRLYTASDCHARPAHRLPALQREDLAGPFLQLHAAGSDPNHFPWLDAPPKESADHASSTLRAIGAVTDEGITREGRAIAAMPLPPRIGRFLCHAMGGRDRELAAACAAVLAERDFASRLGSDELVDCLEADDPRSDLVARARLVMTSGGKARGLDQRALREVMRSAKALQRHGATLENRTGNGGIAEALLAAFPDRVAFRRDRDRDATVLPGRRNAVMDNRSIARGEGFLVAAEIRGLENRGQGRTVLSLATMIAQDLVEEELGDRIARNITLSFNPERAAVERMMEVTFDGVPIREERGQPRQEDRADASEILRKAVEAGEVEIPGWDDSVERWIERARCVSDWFPERSLPGYENDELAVVQAEVLGSAVRMAQVQRNAVGEIVRNAMDWDDRRFVEKMAPERIPLPRGRDLRVSYRRGEPPRGRARIQDLIGLENTPVVAGGRIRVLLEILAPNQRPVQVTEDLASFWARTYPDLKKELRRRYPRHEWP